MGDFGRLLRDRSALVKKPMTFLLQSMIILHSAPPRHIAAKLSVRRRFIEMTGPDLDICSTKFGRDAAF
jgi:hypothetical protein